MGHYYKTWWVWVNRNLLDCFAVNAENDSFGVENIPKGIKKFIWNENIITNIYRI